MSTEEKFYTAKGKLRYSDSGWILLDIHPSIQEYYYFLLKKNFQGKINKPYHDPHITVVAGKYEDVTQNVNWRKYHGNEIEFSYDSFVREKDMYFWLHVESEALVEVRRELGLTDTPKFPYHITIGNLKNCVPPTS